jgi:hypothetical protein
MLNFNLFENIDFHFKCFRGSSFRRKPKKKLDKRLHEVDFQSKISILPLTANYDIENMYPITGNVELWNIFIVGNDKRYILANVNDPQTTIPNHDQLLNKQGTNILPDELTKVFDGVWDSTLTGEQLQFYMVWDSKLYLINTYPFLNEKKKVIGAIMFMRAFMNIPAMHSFPGSKIHALGVRIRNSFDFSVKKENKKK